MELSILSEALNFETLFYCTRKMQEPGESNQIHREQPEF